MSVHRLFWSRRVRVFDLDGTLIHTLPDLAGALNQALREMGFRSLPETLVRASLHAGLEGTVAAACAYLRLPEQVRLPLLARYRRCYAAGLALRSTPMDGVPDLLAQLSARRQPMAVCTNKPQREAEDLLAAFGLRRHFDAVVGADTCAERKPHPLPLRQAVARLGDGLAEALFIGDSAIDAACARAAGTAHLWYGRGYGMPPTGCIWRVDSYRDLLSHREPMAA
jgi:phosphoglycolate phosphatase